MCRFGESSRHVFSFKKLILDYDFSQFAYVIHTCAILNWLALPSAVVRFVKLVFISMKRMFNYMSCFQTTWWGWVKLQEEHLLIQGCGSVDWQEPCAHGQPLVVLICMRSS
jgi:hypothetical protein